MAKPTIYLAGLMTGLPDRGAAWRNQATNLLAPLDVINPLTIELPSHEPKDIVFTDLRAVLNCGAVLVNACEPSWGTAMELWFAREHGVPVVAYHVGMCDPHHYLSPWLRYCATETHASLQLAVDSIRERFSGHL